MQGDLEVVHRFLAASIDVDITDAVRLKFVVDCSFFVLCIE